MSMVDEGKEVGGSAIRVFMLLTLISCVVAAYAIHLSVYNKFYNKQAQARDTAKVQSLVDMGSAMKVPVSSVVSIMKLLEMADVWYVDVYNVQYNEADPSNPIVRPVINYSPSGVGAPDSTDRKTRFTYDAAVTAPVDTGIYVHGDYIQKVVDILRTQSNKYCTVYINTDNDSAPYIVLCIQDPENVRICKLENISGTMTWTYAQEPNNRVGMVGE